MTEVSTTLRTAYLGGPMRGYEEYNSPIFRRVADWLRSKKWNIYSPAERDECDPVAAEDIRQRQLTGNWDEVFDLAYYMEYDLAAVSKMDAMICIPGWEQSQGARLEAIVATELGKPVFEVVNKDGAALAYEELQMGATKYWKLASVNPNYVRAVFAAESLGGYDDFGPLKDEHELSEDCWCEPNFVTVDPKSERIAAMSTSVERKSIPITTGVFDYFPAALVEVAKVSRAGNEKHNPGQPLHHARGKSTDHADSLLRHLIDRGKIDGDTGCRHSAEVAWRALALLQEEMEEEGLASLPRGARA